MAIGSLGIAFYEFKEGKEVFHIAKTKTSHAPAIVVDLFLKLKK